MKYIYKVLEQNKNESDSDYLIRVNEEGQKGFRYITEIVTESVARVLMEKVE